MRIFLPCWHVIKFIATADRISLKLSASLQRELINTIIELKYQFRHVRTLPFDEPFLTLPPIIPLADSSCYHRL
jgi:hypothetical protein